MLNSIIVTKTWREVLMLEYSMLYPKTTSSRRAVSMDGMWKFRLDEGEIGEKEGWVDGIPGKEMIPVPASFQDFYTDKDIREYTGDMWYEKDMFVPGEWEGKDILIRFGAATHRAVVYVNGVRITEHEGGFLPFCADVTQVVRYNAYNKVVVKVNNELTVTNIPCGQTITLPNGKKMTKPYFDFFNYSGLQRSVYLMAVPAVGLFESLMNFMDASSGKATAFFEKETTPILLKAHLRAVEEMITRDKNHPSVIAWSLLNEPETSSEAAVPYFKAVFDRAHELDVQKRPRTFALVMNSVPSVCKCYQFSDMIALNRYYGWYVSGGYEINQAEMLFRKEMDEWKALNLNKPFFFSEYGADTLGSEHKLPSVMWSQEYQEEYLNMTNEVFDSYDFVKGEQIWNFADFQTTEGLLRVNGNKKGVFTRQRQPKSVAYLLKKRWTELPLDYKG